MTHVLAFVAAGLVALAVPGPDFAIVVRNAVVRGRMSGVFTAFGIGSALLVHGTAATLGLSALLATSASAFAVVKLVGAAYLAFLGIQALRAARRNAHVDASPSSDESSSAAETSGRLVSYRQGALTNLLNPKAALFFLSFLPQFVPDSGSKIAWTGGFALLMAVMSVVWFVGVSLLAVRVRAFLQRPRVTRVFEGATGSVFVGLAAKLALAHR